METQMKYHITPRQAKEVTEEVFTHSLTKSFIGRIGLIIIIKRWILVR